MGFLDDYRSWLGNRLTGPTQLEVALKVDWKLWIDTLFLRTLEANRGSRQTGFRLRARSSLRSGRLLLTATLTLQSNGLQSAVLTVVTPTLITLVMSPFTTDVSDDEVVPDGLTKDVIETTWVTLVTLAVVSEVISKEF